MRVSLQCYNISLDIMWRNYVISWLHFPILLVLVRSTEICHCPCSRQNKKSREKYELLFVHVCNPTDGKKSKGLTKFSPNGLMMHLQHKGGDYTCSDRSSGTRERKYVEMDCVFHYATFKFLHVAFGDYYEGKFKLFQLVIVSAI